MLRMFLQDSHTRIKEARPIIKEIINSLRRFSNNSSVIVSFNYTQPSEYYQMLIPYFDKCIHMTNDESDISVSYYKKKDSRIISTPTIRSRNYSSERSNCQIGR